MIARTYPLFSSLMIVLINKLMVYLAHSMVDLELHITETERIKSLTIKCIESQLYNSVFGIIGSTLKEGLIPGKLQYNLGMPFVLTIFWQMLKSPLLVAYSMNYTFTKLIPRLWITRKLKTGKVSHITQRELNKLYDPPSIKLHTRYSSYLRTTILYLIYSSFAPISSLAVLGYLIHQFSMDKHMMLRRNKKTVVMSEDVAYLMAEWLKNFVVLHLMFVWYNVISSNYWVKDNGRLASIKFSQFIWAAVIVAIAIFPLKRTVASWTRLQDISQAEASQEYGGRYIGLTSGVVMTDDTPYEHLWTDLVDDYDRLNPMTKHEAYSKWMAARDKLLHDDR